MIIYSILLDLNKQKSKSSVFAALVASASGGDNPSHQSESVCKDQLSC
jgi:hypothetical protein